MEEVNMKDKPIFSPTIAGELIHMGFELKNQRPDYNDPAKWVYFFEATPELLAAFDKILLERHE
jgi:hypothetical protein